MLHTDPGSMLMADDKYIRQRLFRDRRTCQVRFSVNSALSGYLATGWLGNTDAAAGTTTRDSNVGVDPLAMIIYRLKRVFAIGPGAAYAQLDDSVSGYIQSVLGASGAAARGRHERSVDVIS